MRARDIKPGFFKNEQLAECSLEARLLFPGLWMFADREGRFEDRPKRIKAEVFPYDNFDVESLLCELCKHGLIVRYEVNGVRYACIPTFLKHQRPHQNEKASEIPAIETDSCKMVESTLHQGDKCLSPDSEALRPSSLTPSSLTPSSLTNTPLTPHGGTECSLLELSNPPQSGAKKSKRKPKGTEVVPYSDEFLECWKLYPRKDCKQEAWKAFQELRKAGVMPDDEDMRIRIHWRRFCDDWDVNKDPSRVKYIPHMATWLRRHGWEDEGCFLKDDPRNTPLNYIIGEIAGKYGFGDVRPGESYEDLKERQRLMEEEIEQAEAEYYKKIGRQIYGHQ